MGKSQQGRRANCGEVLVPARYRVAHDYCLRLLDQVTRLMDHGHAADLFKVNLRLTRDEAREWNQTGWHPWDWLEKTNRPGELGELLMKSLFPALVTDLCDFVHEALVCSEKRKLTVTFALLRKPLQENLLFLEWLLADPDELLNAFYNEQPGDLLKLRGVSDPKRVKTIIAGAIANLPGEPFWNADWQHEIRYDLTCPYGLAVLFHKALHLITTRRQIPTEEQNLNFVFSGDDCIDSQWEGLYTTLPFVLYHAAEVCESLMAGATRTVMPDYHEVSVQRMLGFLLFADELQGGTASGNKFSELEARCQRCNDSWSLDHQSAFALYDAGAISCPSCRCAVGLRDLTGIGLDARSGGDKL